MDNKLTRDEFLDLSAAEQRFAIYEKEGGSAAAPASLEDGFNKVFTREGSQPQQPERELPPGFKAIYGEEPPRNTGRNSKGYARDKWEIELTAFGGLIDLTAEISYMFKAALSSAAGLGVPVAFLRAGKKILTFENSTRYQVPFEYWSTQYQTSVAVAGNALSE